MTDKKEEEIFEIKIVCAFFSLIIAMTIVLEIGFYRTYTSANVFEMYFVIIATPIIYGIFFAWVLTILWTNFKEKYQNIQEE